MKLKNWKLKIDTRVPYYNDSFLGLTTDFSEAQLELITPPLKATNLSLDFLEDIQPYTTHPKIDLMVGPSSSHPIREFGCTSCHAGRGRGTGFYSSAHSPNDKETEHRWKEELDWKPMHHWENPMLPTRYAEAGCYKCHSGNMPLKEA